MTDALLETANLAITLPAAKMSADKSGLFIDLRATRTIAAALGQEILDQFGRPQTGPLDSDWLRSLGGLPDDSGDGSLYFKIWLPNEPAERYFDDGIDSVHLYVTPDGEFGVESYTCQGATLAIIELGKVKDRNHFLRLAYELGVILKHQEKQHGSGVIDQVPGSDAKAS